MKLTCQIQLIPTTGQKQDLLLLMERFNLACDFVSRFAFEHNLFGNYNLHHKLYRQIRARFGLSAQLTVSVFSKVADAYTTEKSNAKRQNRSISLCRFQKIGAVPYDSRILTYGKDNLCSIRLLTKRTTIAMSLWDESRLPFFQGEADLVYRKGQFYLLQTMEVPVPPVREVSDFLGVDLGLARIAVDSDSNVYTDERIEHKRRKFSHHRQSLKKKKTKNSRRRLARLGRREAAFRKDVNHCISKKLVSLSSRTCRGIALEDLHQFFDKTRVRKEYRASRCSWSFHQLGCFIAYKAMLCGLPLCRVDPAYTSQTCSNPQCGKCDKKNRKDQEHFVCIGCGFTANADFNASVNIRYRAVVNLPETPCTHWWVEGSDAATITQGNWAPSSAAKVERNLDSSHATRLVLVGS